MALPKVKQFEIEGQEGKKIRVRASADGVSVSSTPSNFVLVDEAQLVDLVDALHAAKVLVEVRRVREAHRRKES